MKNFDENVWKLVTELAQEERHFNIVQHHYRMLASTWLLAMFGAIGFALSKENIMVPPALIVATLGLAGAVGIALLWNLDIRVYHQLLDSCFVQGLQLEKEYPWLPQLRSSMLSTQVAGGELEAQVPHSFRQNGILDRVVWFYVIQIAFALLVSLVGLVVLASQMNILSSPIYMFTTMVVGVVLIVFVGSRILRHTRSPLLERWSNE